jgi:hypothetical protein
MKTITEIKKGIDIQCYNEACNHEWSYKGSMLYACCPSCRRNVKVELGKIQFAKSHSQS